MNPSFPRSVFLLAVLASIGATDPAKALGWTITSVDGPGDIGWFASIDLDSQQNPGISYCAASTDDLRFARIVAGVWQVETVDATGRTGWYTSLAFNASDSPCIAYWDLTNSALRYAHWDGTTWLKQTIDNAAYVGQCCSLALDGAGNPHISYYDYTNGDLKYARWDGAAWRIEVVESGPPLLGVGLYTSLVLDSMDRPHISHADHTNGLLRYARWDGAAWQFETVDGGTPLGTSIQFDGTGVPHISYSYQFGQGSHLKYAARNGPGGTWVVQILRPGGQVGLYSSIQLSPGGDPRILSWDLGHYRVNYDSLDDGIWTREDIEAMSWTDQWCALALDRYGRLHAAYRSSNDADLHYALGADPAAAEELPQRQGLRLTVVPNPSDGAVTARLVLERTSHIRLTLYDVGGCRLALLADGIYRAGETAIEIPAPASSGSRILRVEGDDGRASTRVVQIR